MGEKTTSHQRHRLHQNCRIPVMSMCILSFAWVANHFEALPLWVLTCRDAYVATSTPVNHLLVAACAALGCRGVLRV